MSKIEEIVKSTRRDRQFVEGSTLGGILCPTIRIGKYSTYLYGIGAGADLYISWFSNQNIEIKGIIDKDINKKGKKILGVPYIHTSDLNAGIIENPSQSIVFIATDFYTGIEQFKILQILINAGFDKIYHLNQHEKRTIRGITVDGVVGRSQYFRENVEHLEKTYQLLSDEKSKCIMLEYIRTYVECGVYSLESLAGRNKYFYDGRTVEERKEIYSHLDDEVWVNCGACIGDNVFLYFDNGLNAKKIYAFEGDATCYQRLCTSLEYLPDQYREKVCAIEEYISADTSFAEHIEGKVTLLNADIQGNEMEMLCAMKDIIQKDRPVIAVCVYHKPEDLHVIPQYIDGLVDDYKYVLRKYEADIDDSTRAWELVLYAVPTERYVLQ